MNEFACLDCGVDTFAIGEYYMVHDSTWRKMNPKGSGMLCFNCGGKRLGRQLIPQDFIDAPINRRWRRVRDWELL